MSDLYDELGVARDATQEEIRKAYRKRAAETHPDKGGDEEAFKRASHAHLILSDPVKRDRYDRTGGENDHDPEAREWAMALEMLASQLNHIFGSAEFDLTRHDPLRAMMKMLKQTKARAQAAIKEADATLDKMAKTRKRMKRKTGSAEGRLDGVLDALKRDQEMAKEKANRTLRVCKKARMVINEHTYEIDQLSAAEKEAHAQMEVLRNAILGRSFRVPDEFLRGRKP